MYKWMPNSLNHGIHLRVQIGIAPLLKRWDLDKVEVGVTRLGDLLDFGQLFKAFGNN